jgi:hypothetical protein
MLLQDAAFEKLHKQFRTKIDLGIALLEAALPHTVPFSVLVFDSWYLAEELVSMARYRKKDWISLLRHWFSVMGIAKCRRLVGKPS